ncbi:MAG: hypothetical protein IJ291_02690 [Lachnospiraceae bacterium]|nr:hypothetical protein [Lachnospiraceae bacterium]
MKEKLKNLITKLKEKLIPKLKTFIKKRWKLLLIVAGVLATIAIILNALRYTPVGLQLYARVMPFQLISLYTNYGDFTISNGKQSAVFVNGKKVSGDLPVYRTEVEWDEIVAKTYYYKYYLCPLRRTQKYELYPNTSKWCETRFVGEMCYEYDIESKEGGYICLNSNWMVTTQTKNEVWNRVSLYWIKSLGDKWLGADIGGKTTGISGSVSHKGYFFSSSEECIYKVNVWTFPKECHFESIEVDEDGILLKEKNSKEGIIMRGKEVIERFDISDSERVWF